jgi:shikimate dehydrogenase
MQSDRYAVVGNPIKHSRSPEIHSAFAAATGQALTYERLLAPLERFVETIEEFRRVGALGCNVTLPFKEQAYRYAGEHTPRAARAGSVNTLKFGAGDVLGDNTDGAGLVADIENNLRASIAGTRMLLLGAGGAARGVLPALLDRRPAQIVIVNRTAERARALAEDFPGVAEARDSLRAGETFDIVINATSAGLAGETPTLPDGLLARARLAYDMVYGRDDTPFARAARQQGAALVADGLGMLVEQAAESFLLWRGIRPLTPPVLALLRNG